VRPAYEAADVQVEAATSNRRLSTPRGSAPNAMLCAGVAENYGAAAIDLVFQRPLRLYVEPPALPMQEPVNACSTNRARLVSVQPRQAVR
jgi:hypothetical protein